MQRLCRRNYIQRRYCLRVTTGFGVFANTKISRQDTDFCNKLIRSHACGMGARSANGGLCAAIMRCNSLAFGKSGIRETTLLTLVGTQQRVHPIVPEKGSSRAIGALSAHRSGHDGRRKWSFRWYERRRGHGNEHSCRQIETRKVSLLSTGTQIMTAIGALAMHDAIHLIKMADIVAALAQALCAITKLSIHGLLRPIHKGQAACAKILCGY